MSAGLAPVSPPRTEWPDRRIRLLRPAWALGVTGLLVAAATALGISQAPTQWFFSVPRGSATASVTLRQAAQKTMAAPSFSVIATGQRRLTYQAPDRVSLGSPGTPLFTVVVGTALYTKRTGTSTGVWIKQRVQVSYRNYAFDVLEALVTARDVARHGPGFTAVVMAYPAYYAPEGLPVDFTVMVAGGRVIRVRWHFTPIAAHVVAEHLPQRGRGSAEEQLREPQVTVFSTFGDAPAVPGPR